MLTIRQYYLAKLAEEAIEVAQRAIKSQQFGDDEIQDGQPYNNSERLAHEVIHFLAVLEICTEESWVMDVLDDVGKMAMEAKQRKVEKFLVYSQELGQVGKS